jgi:methionine-rich copper-binding protein CopC
MGVRRGAVLIVGVAVLGLVQPAAVRAHAELTSSSPADGARLRIPPTEVNLVFDGELLPDGTGFVVTDAEGRSVGQGVLDLIVPDRNEVRGTVTIAGPGTFTVAWTAVAADGHTESGSLSFTVGTTASSQPDTAMESAATDAMPIIAGVHLLAAATVLRARRRRGDATRPGPT